jgi:hypothetical protein
MLVWSLGLFTVFCSSCDGGAVGAGHWRHEGKDLRHNRMCNCGWAGLAVVFLFKQSVAVSGLCSLLVARALVCSQGGASVQALTGVCTVWCGFTAHIRIVMRTTANKVVQSSMDSQFTHDSTSNQYRAESRRGSEPTAGP